MVRTALFVVSIYNYHREVFPVVREFCDHGWRVAVIIGWQGQLADEAASDYARLGCSVGRLEPDIAYGDPTLAMVSGRHAPTPTRKPSSLRRPLSVAFQLRAMLRVKAVVERMLSSINPSVVLCGPFHSCGTFDNAIAAWARTQRIPLCCYPVSAYHGAKGAVRARFQNLRVGMLPPAIGIRYDVLNRALAWLFPAWTRRRDADGIFMWDPTRMLAAWLSGLLERDTWQKPATGMSAVYVFSEFSRQLLEESGYPMERVVVSGTPLLDAVFRQAHDPTWRRVLFADLELRDDEEFVLFNVEPSAEHHYADWDEHWRNFHTMMQIVTGVGMPVVLSLHPLCRESDYAFAETQYGVRISRRHKIYDLYPHCRIAVSFPCSTNLVAEVFGKPLVIYDFHDMAGPDSDRASEYRLPGALIGHTPAELEERVRVALERGRIDARVTPTVQGRASETIRKHVESLIGVEIEGSGGVAVAGAAH